MSTPNRVVLVTGASRGIGKADADLAGVVVAWLATDDHAAAHHGATVAARTLGPELGLSG